MGQRPLPVTAEPRAPSLENHPLIHSRSLFPAAACGQEPRCGCASQPCLSPLWAATSSWRALVRIKGVIHMESLEQGLAPSAHLVDVCS